MGAAAESRPRVLASASEPVGGDQEVLASASEPERTAGDDAVDRSGRRRSADRRSGAAVTSATTPRTWGDDRVGALPAGLSRDELIAEVKRAAGPVPQGAAILVAVSGGPDSTAMAHLLSLARPDLRLELAHIRHGLRDDTEDAAVAAAHADELETDHYEAHVEVRVGRLGPEAAARDARYRALFDRAKATSATWVAIGHTADDQAETVLMNVVRGSGLSGLAGMQPVRPGRAAQLLRPLLRIRRTDVSSFIAGEGLWVVADPTNRDPAQRRSRARHKVLPMLEQLAGGPGDVVGALSRVAALARIDTAALDALAHQHAERLTVAWGPTLAVRMDLLGQLPRAVSTRVLRAAAAAVGAGALSSATVSRVVALEPGEALHVSHGVFVTCGGGWLGFAPGDLTPLRPEVLAVPGTTRLPQLGLDVHVEWPWPLAPSADPQQLDLGPPEPAAVADVADYSPAGGCASTPPGAGPRARMWAVFSDRVGHALANGVDFMVRPRRDGDRLRCTGGVRKLQDLLVDAHVPRACRDLLPVVVDEHDEPLWIPGVAQRASDDTVTAGMRMWLAPAASDSERNAGHDLE
ncbi:hypothetical protein BH23ACT10_BH23ACT10_02000 [soil metagenome]